MLVNSILALYFSKAEIHVNTLFYNAENKKFLIVRDKAKAI